MDPDPDFRPIRTQEKKFDPDPKKNPDPKHGFKAMLRSRSRLEPPLLGWSWSRKRSRLETPFFAWSRSRPNLVGVGSGTSDFRSQSRPKRGSSATLV